MTRAFVVVLLPLLMSFSLFGCGKEQQTVTPNAPETIPFRIDGSLDFVRNGEVLKTIEIEVADTDSTRGRGLMHRNVIPSDTGMLFIFPSEEDQAFYMMNTPRSLDIQFYAADSSLVNIVEDTTPFSLDNVYSTGPAQFVVEVAAGESRRLGLVPGDRIRWRLKNAPTAAADSMVSVAP